jgi:hypothetical protein
VKARFRKRFEARRWRKVYTWWKRQVDQADERLRILAFSEPPSAVASAIAARYGHDPRFVKVHRLIRCGQASPGSWINGKLFALGEVARFTERKGPLLTGRRRLGIWGVS